MDTRTMKVFPNDGKNVPEPKIQSDLVEAKSIIRGAIPILNIPLACLCFLFNFFAPGSGKFKFCRKLWALLVHDILSFHSRYRNDTQWIFGTFFWVDPVFLRRETILLRTSVFLYCQYLCWAISIGYNLAILGRLVLEHWVGRDNDPIST